MKVEDADPQTVNLAPVGPTVSSPDSPEQEEVALPGLMPVKFGQRSGADEGESTQILSTPDPEEIQNSFQQFQKTKSSQNRGSPPSTSEPHLILEKTTQT